MTSTSAPPVLDVRAFVAGVTCRDRLRWKPYRYSWYYSRKTTPTRALNGGTEVWDGDLLVHRQFNLLLVLFPRI